MTLNPTPNPAFRPDPNRGIFLSQPIDQTTLDRLVPTVLRFQPESRQPISVFIDSVGGSVYSANNLQRVLRSLDQDGNAPCRLITVATGTAASAAADLLMGGDYALAYPHTRILCHGVSRQGTSLTRETAYELALELADSNERFAIQLADNCIRRFIFRVAVAASEFPAIRTKENNPNLSHGSCFIEYVRDKLSASLIHVLEDALKRSLDNDALDMAVAQSLQNVNDVAAMPPLEFEVHMLKAILDYEAQQHSSDSNWRFGRNGLETVQDKLQLLLDKYSDHHSEVITALSSRWAESFLSSEELDAISKLPDADQPKQREVVGANYIRPLWFFFVSVCRALQMDDYWMSADEAYWLGLIDEVIGRTDLPCPRMIVEYQPEEIPT